MLTIREEYGRFLDSVFEATEALALQGTPESLQSVIQYQLRGLDKSKGFRPALVLAGAQASHEPYDYDDLIRKAAYVQLIHESSLIIDDILDQDTQRRGQRALHCVYGRTLASCAAGWLNSVVLRELYSWPKGVWEVNQLLVGVVKGEGLQQQLRHAPRPIRLLQWREIAGYDTGAFFRFALHVGGYWMSAELVQLLAVLYHGLDDVADLLDAGALAGGLHADVRDHIPTLLACFADDTTVQALRAALPQALAYLRQQFDNLKSIAGTEFYPFYRELWSWYQSCLSHVEVI